MFLFGRFRGNEESILKVLIFRRACKIPSLEFEQQILSQYFFNATILNKIAKYDRFSVKCHQQVIF